MKLTYDTTTDTLYVELRPGAGAEAEEVADDFVIDFDKDGAMVGLEIQHASQHVDLTRVETYGLSGTVTAARSG